MDNYKHYIRLDNEGYIVKGFSDAFEKPQENDILLKETQERHFKLELYNDEGRPCKKYDGNKIIDEVKPYTQAELDNMNNVQVLADIKKSDSDIVRLIEDIALHLESNNGFVIPQSQKDRITERATKRSNLK